MAEKTSDPDHERRALDEVERLLDLEDEAARGEGLRALRERDGELAATVERLLRRNPDAHGWMPTEGPGLWAAEEDRAPDRIGPFAITGILGRGGMGVVLRGERDDGLFAQTVAIKLMRSGLTSLRLQERFILERRILARLDHGGICRILDGGTWEERPFLIMDHVDGRAITEYVAAAGLDLQARLRLFLDICAVVQYAHRQLIVHADLKPSNILITPDGQVKLLDFGIARLIGDEVGEAAPATGGEASGTSGSRSVTLTRAYAAPERRDGARPTIEGDVFSLGAILFELLAGRLPDVPAGADWPPASSAAAAPPVTPAMLAGDLDAIVAKAVSRDPADRYPDVAALIADIEAWFGHYPVGARAAGWRERSMKFVRRHRSGFAVAAGVGLLLASAAIFSAVQAVRAERARAVAEKRFDDVRTLANAMLFDVQDALARYPGTVDKRAALAATGARYLAALQLSAEAPADLRLDAAKAYRRLAAIQGYPGTSNIGEPDQARASLGRAQALLAALVADQPDNAAAHAELGWVHADRWASVAGDGPSQAQIDAAARSFAAALALAPDDASATLGQIALDRARAFEKIWSADRPAEAIPIVREALTRLRARRWPTSLAASAAQLEIGLLNQQGDATYYSGDLAGALLPYREADALIDRRIAAGGATPTLLIAKATSAFNIGGTLGDMDGRDAEALAIVDRSVAAMERLLAAGRDSSAEKALLTLYGQQAVLLENMGRLDVALGPLLRGNAFREARLAAHSGDGAARRDLAIGLAQQARVSASAGRKAEACALAERTLALWAKLEGQGALTPRDAAKERPVADALRRANCQR